MMRPTPAALAMVLALAACELSGPGNPHDPDYGTITATVRGQAWTSEITTDSIVAWYNDSTGHLMIAGSRTDDAGDNTSLALLRCGSLTTGHFGFAHTANGPFGYTALALGVVGSWTEPMRVASPQVDEPFVFRELSSIGAPGDALVIEALDLDDMVIRGRFQFQAVSPLGYVQLQIAGRFAGRIFPSFQACELQH